MTARFARIPIRAAALHLGAQDFRVLICIAGHADRDGRAHPSQRLIASFTGISRPNVAHSIARLQRAGLLQRHRNKRADGGWDQSAYHILFDDPRVLSTETPAVVFGDTGVLFPDTLGCCFQRHTEQSHRTESQNRLRGAPYADNDSAVAWFERFWRAYPDRGPHPNPKKPARESSWRPSKRASIRRLSFAVPRPIPRMPRQLPTAARSRRPSPGLYRNATAMRSRPRGRQRGRA